LQPSAVPASATTATAVSHPLAAFRLASAASIRLCSRPTSTRLAPALARPMAIARPIPLDEPVTMAFLPVRSICICLFLDKAKTRSGQCGFHDAVAEQLAPTRITGRTGHRHQRQQVFLATLRMAEPRRRRLLPLHKRRLALYREQLNRVDQPGIELVGYRPETGIAVAAHVVKAHTAADDQYAFVTQTGQCPARFEQCPGIE